jgi:hypothetical protein
LAFCLLRAGCCYFLHVHGCLRQGVLLACLLTASALRGSGHLTLGCRCRLHECALLLASTRVVLIVDACAIGRCRT